MENKQQTEIKQGTRLKEIIAVMRKYHFISNFYHQRDPEAICNALQELGQPLLSWGKSFRPGPT